MTTTRKQETIFVDREGGPDENQKFCVLANGYMERWTIEKIKEAVERGDIVKEWERG